MKVYSGMEVQFHSFLTSAQMEFNGHLHGPVSLSPEKTPGTQWTGGWVDPRARFDGCETEKRFCPYSVSSKVDNL